MIQAVIFDVGGVLVRTHDHSRRRAWEQRLGLNSWESEEIVFNSEMGTKAQSGFITDAELWQWVQQRLSLNTEQFARFRADFWAGDVLDLELVAYIRSLRPAYQTAIISNATDNLLPALRDQFQIVDTFDLIVGSAEEHVMKPAAEIYLRTLHRLQRRPEESVFIDDNADNISAAADLGMYTVFYRPGINVPVLLSEMGVSPSGRPDRQPQVAEGAG